MRSKKVLAIGVLLAVSLVAMIGLLGALRATKVVSAQNNGMQGASTQVITGTAAVTATNLMTSVATGDVYPLANEELGTLFLRLAHRLSAPSDLLYSQMLTTLPSTISISEALQMTPELQAGTPNANMQAVLDKLADLHVPPINHLSTRKARLVPLADAAVAVLLAERGQTTTPQPVSAIANQLIPARDGQNILVRIYTPAGAGPFPVVVYFHGGGWVIGDLDTYDASARALTKAAGAIVVSVAYRQAPENPFPAAVEDAYLATQWVMTDAASFHGDPAHVAVAGENAGGNLAADVSLLARERGEPMPVYQVLIDPVLQAVSTDTPSYQTYADAKPLNKPMMQWFFERYLLDNSDATNPYVSPLLVKDLSGLPPTTIIAAEIDPLFSEGQAFANRLREAGVPVVYQSFPGVTHEFFGMGALLDESKQAVDLAAQGLHSAFLK